MYDFHYEAKAEEDLIDLLEDGEIDFEITAVKRMENDKGFPMAKFNLKAWDKNGRDGFVTDFIVFDGSNFQLRKYRHLCYSVGLGELYEAKKANAADFVGKTGKALSRVKPAGTGKNGKFYQAQNAIVDYLIPLNDDEMSELRARQEIRSKQSTERNDDVPPVSAYEGDIPL